MPSLPQPETPGGYTLPERRWRCTLPERRWRCVQNYLFSCKASPLGCPDPADLCADLWDLLPPAAPARSRVRLARHVDSFDANSVRAHCAAWLLDPFSFLQGCPCSQHDAVCSVLAAFVLLVGTSVADAAVPVGALVFTSELARRSLSALALLHASCVAELFPLPFCPAWGAEAETPLRQGVVHNLVFPFLPFVHAWVHPYRYASV
jgi:hypothetical protein